MADGNRLGHRRQLLGVGMLPVKAGSPTKPVPGYDVRVLGDDNREMPAGKVGSIAIRLPLRPGGLPTLWNNDDGYATSYLTRHPGHYLTGDAGYEDGYVFIMSRIDDITTSPAVGSPQAPWKKCWPPTRTSPSAPSSGLPTSSGEVRLGFVVTEAGVVRGEHDLVKELVERVHDSSGSVAAFRFALVVDRLSTNRSGKTLRGTMKQIANGVEYTVPAAIDDPAVLGGITEALQRIGYPKPATGR